MILTAMNSAKLRLCFMMVVFAAGVLACGQEGDLQADPYSGTGTYRARLVFPQDIPRIDSTSKAIEGGIDCNAAGIETITCSLFSAEGMRITSVVWQCSQGEGTVDNIPPGHGINVVVTAEDADRIVLLRGEDRDIAIAAGKVTDSGEIEMISVAPVDIDGDGYSPPEDCDDDDPDVNPEAEEIFDNGVDEDCDGRDGETFIWYRDSDGDGYGDLDVNNTGENPPDGYVPNSRDCDDGNSSIHPGAVEICNGADDNCDGSVDEGLGNTYYRDSDGDGYGDASQTTQACSVPVGYASNSDDCDDNNQAVHPDAAESCNGLDDDCDGSVDDGEGYTYYRDSDGDGYGTASQTTQACSRPSGYASNGDDCDDSNPNIHPGATEICGNIVDEDCDGTYAYTCPDSDSDGIPDANDQCPNTPTTEPVNSDGCSDSQLATPDRYEPNNTYTQASNLGGIIGDYNASNLNISSGDVDYYSFELITTGTANDYVEISLQNNAYSGRGITDLDLAIGKINNRGNFVPQHGSWYDSASLTDSLTERVSLESNDPGVYYIIVFGASGYELGEDNPDFIGTEISGYTLHIHGPE